MFISKQNSQTFIVLFCLIISLSHSLSPPATCLGYSNQVASYAVFYATCSNVLDNFADQIREWSYAPCVEAQKPEQMTDITVITNYTYYVLAFVAYDKGRNLIVLSFRATVCGKNNQNVKTDANITQITYSNQQYKGKCTTGITHKKCAVHKGFYNSYASIQTQVRSITEALMIKYKAKNPKLLITGISLGGAIAAIASFDLSVYLKFKGHNIDILPYTFGQPRIGNKKLIDQINDEVKIIRIINQADPVPHLPPRQFNAKYFLDTIHPDWNQVSRTLFITSAKYFLKDYWNPGLQVFFYKPKEKPYICAGDNEKCSLNKFPSLQGCQHLQYNTINFNTPGCYLLDRSYDNTITESQSSLQSSSSSYFILYFFNSTKCNPKQQLSQYFNCFGVFPPQLDCSKQHSKTENILLTFNGIIRDITPNFEHIQEEILHQEPKSERKSSGSGILSKLLSCKDLLRLPKNPIFPVLPLTEPEEKSDQL